MAKRERIFPDRSITLQVNDVVLEYLEDLAKTGVYGNTYPQAAEIVLRHGLQQLIATGALKVKSATIPKDGESDD
jgi:hypothetical protein